MRLILQDFSPSVCLIFIDLQDVTGAGKRDFAKIKSFVFNIGFPGLNNTHLQGKG